MATFLTDSEIAGFIAEPKQLPPDWRNRVKLKPKHGHYERELDITGENGSKFRVVMRQTIANSLDFSVILGLLVPKTNQVFRLMRFNGKSHEHTNKIEGTRFYDFHIHRATERYQKDGYDEESYAEVTDRYSSFEEALETLILEGGFVRPLKPQMDLDFDEGGSP
ncbi:MAG: hypothetical protein AABZ47_00150 [Planctomycetota bacterium]